MGSLRAYILEVAKKAKSASRLVARIQSGTKNRILLEAARLIEKHRKRLRDENEKDLRNAQREKLSPVLIDRLALTPERIDDMG